MDRQDADHGKAQQDPNEQGPREIVRREGKLLPGSFGLRANPSHDPSAFDRPKKSGVEKTARGRWALQTAI